MRKLRIITLLIPLLIVLVFLPKQVAAASQGVENMKQAKNKIAQAIDLAKQDLSKAKPVYEQFHDQWMDEEDSVKSDSLAAYKDIETQMGQVEYELLVNKQDEAITALVSLQQVLDKYTNGQFANVENVKEADITLAGFVSLLEQTKNAVQQQDQVSSLNAISKVRESWLSVEGNVVAQSSTVYSNTERDMVVANAMITDHKYEDAASLLTDMITYLTPLSQKSTYTLWDAAMIPIREGLEALLVVGALLAYVKKSKDQKGKLWIWVGVMVGLIVSAALAVIVKYVFSSGAFGNNNFLIGGWTGVFAAVMLLYMSYWLHSKSNLEQWNTYIQEKTQTALSTGNIVSLGILTFLAVFREGTETVLFIIGMANQISAQQLLLGIMVGFGVLGVVAFIMLYIGAKLPIRPFFLTSSLIVLYLCIKFAGLGINSLQLAGAIPTTNSSVLPSIRFLAFFPSWESAIPQILIIAVAIIVVVRGKIKSSTRTANT
ncbi:FTR1 family iron permease [Paenibacillus sabinae]|uniref:High-affinity Fe2+/Pb2+ permease n=1 Tax=Paenibacillus sabinae T27 TaxID=1268072 RepID=X5A0S2_9BACL|nr:FTR1 family protein [Paenibacillus sabinae]AHV97459.1 high-affinity Fe2+/Pb2+ permease [Paenibacillus sabinae T27]